ncbi:Hypothetical protein SRAE_1000041600 [Strongyloides ratti]|uniref:Uncharacterized protein n=1 Tax=Strongyloides ratti TaxID=34506 RepID=A0A090L209_STRRB|nr:Hypothetical protein SRAE_1000041600 [Strongyloides ratti]CEF62142.1 Hypothetical protein SRAE_1000041600 [Strongyloides ratti]
MFESIPIRVIIEPILSFQYSTEYPMLEKELQMTVTINSNTLIKDLCEVILNQIGLGHIACYSEAYIQPPYSTDFVMTSRFNDIPVTIGKLEEMVGDTSVFKIAAHGTVTDFSGIDYRNCIYRNLVKFFIKKYPSIINNISNPIIKDIIENVNNCTLNEVSHHTLYEVNEILEKEINSLVSNEQSIPEILSNCNNTNKEISSVVKEENINFSEENQQDSTLSSTFTKCNNIQNDSQEPSY